MFGLFGKKKKKTGGPNAGGSGKPSTPHREALIREAMNNARKAREEIGDETIQKIAEALRKKENSPFEQARRKIEGLNRDRVADNIRTMIDED